jgi:TonB family protein
MPAPPKLGSGERAKAWPASPKLGGGTRAKAALAALAIGAAVGVSAQRPAFTPPRLLNAELPPLPAPTIVGGGEVIIEATVDRSGRLIRPNVLRGTPPYTNMMLDAVTTWRFAPASVRSVDGKDEAVDTPVTIAALYRPPVLMNAPTIGEPPKDWSKPSAEVAYPIAMEMPNYPPNARDEGVVLLEVKLDEAGAVTDTRGVASVGGFDSAARAAVSQWRFKGGTHRWRPVPTTTYVLFGFRSPVVSSPRLPLPPTKR